MKIVPVYTHVSSFLVEKLTKRTNPKMGYKEQTNPKQGYTIQELAEAWKNFKPVVPLSFVLACRRAIKEKYR